jgi:hypothetical protein
MILLGFTHHDNTPTGGGGGEGDYAFNMTAVDIAGIYVGYIGGSFGSIDAEPLEENAVVYVVSGTQNVIAMEGDCVALLTGKEVWVDGVNYGLGDNLDWIFSESYTLVGWTAGGPTFVPSETYLIEFITP